MWQAVKVTSAQALPPHMVCLCSQAEQFPEFDLWLGWTWHETLSISLHLLARVSQQGCGNSPGEMATARGLKSCPAPPCVSSLLYPSFLFPEIQLLTTSQITAHPLPVFHPPSYPTCSSQAGLEECNTFRCSKASSPLSPWQTVKAPQSLTSSRLANLTFHSPLPPPGQSHPLVPPELPSDHGRTEPASPSSDSVSASLRAEVTGIHQTVTQTVTVTMSKLWSLRLWSKHSQLRSNRSIPASYFFYICIVIGQEREAK